jgi:hypothetical protein
MMEWLTVSYRPALRAATVVAPMPLFAHCDRYEDHSENYDANFRLRTPGEETLLAAGRQSAGFKTEAGMVMEPIRPEF